jgi:hypothetical protein
MSIACSNSGVELQNMEVFKREDNYEQSTGWENHGEKCTAGDYGAATIS